MKDIFTLKEKVVCITGGYGHLGKSMTFGLRDYGASLVVLGRSIEKYNAEFLNEENISFIECDVSSTLSIQNAFESINTQFGKIDVLINNAFYIKGAKDVDAVDDNAWNHSMDGLITSVQRCIREVLPYFRKNGGGKIINISSMYGMVAPDFKVYEGFEQFTSQPQYGAAKAALIQMTKYYASLLGKENILVNAISPGPFPNEEVQKSTKFIEMLAKKTTLNRIGSPNELNGAIVFLSSNASSYLTGQNIAIDGGWTIL